MLQCALALASDIENKKFEQKKHSLHHTPETPLKRNKAAARPDFQCFLCEVESYARMTELRKAWPEPRGGHCSVCRILLCLGVQTLRNSSISELHLLVISAVVSEESGWMIGWERKFFAS